ncbi:MAG: TldD/PmbA family protein [Bacteroidaceae bacterium]|nr:TldD/PmbA family protein [Bacteroidaceae bacterium]
MISKKTLSNSPLKGEGTKPQVSPLRGDLVGSVLAAALSGGSDYADIFIENTRISSMVLQDSAVSQAQQVCLYGAGIRAVQGAETGYAYTMDLSEKALIKAARSLTPAVSPAPSKGGRLQDPAKVNGGTALSWQFTSPLEGTGEAILSLPPAQVRQLLLQVEEKAHALDASVIKVKAYVSQRMQEVQFAGSDGTAFHDFRPRTSLSVSIVMERGGQAQMGYATRMMQMDAEFFTDALIEEVVSEAIQRTDFLFTASQIEGGEMPVVMAAGSSGILLHEAIGHAFEADFIRTGDSIFTGQLGKQICNPSISIVDDGTLPNDAGMLRFDDEGIPGQRTVLVENGRLNSFLYDRISAKHFGVEPTGNGRRESFRCTPIPRMRSTYMLPGEAKEEDIIRSVKRGIYAQSFTNGQVQIGAGDFTFFMKTGYLIEDGKLTRPLRDLNIIGNGPEALRRISMVGDNLRIDHSASMCGKEGQKVAVSQGLPTVLIDKLIVG